MIEVDKVWFDEVNYLLEVQKIKEGMRDNINLVDIRPVGPPIAGRGLMEELNEAQDEINARIAKGIKMMMAAEFKRVDRDRDKFIAKYGNYGIPPENKVEKPVKKKKEVDHSAAWTALCIMETFLTDEDNYPGFTTYQRECGVMETRYRIIEMAVESEEVWEEFHKLTDDNYDGAFDFEFVPMFLKLCTNAASGELRPKYGERLEFAFRYKVDGCKEAAKLLEKHWLEDGVW